MYFHDDISVCRTQHCVTCFKADVSKRGAMLMYSMTVMAASLLVLDVAHPQSAHAPNIGTYIVCF